MTAEGLDRKSNKFSKTTYPYSTATDWTLESPATVIYTRCTNRSNTDCQACRTDIFVETAISRINIQYRHANINVMAVTVNTEQLYNGAYLVHRHAQRNVFPIINPSDQCVSRHFF